MALADMKAFYRFTREAAVHELEERKRDLESLIAHISSTQVMRDARYLLSRIDMELEVRMSMQTLQMK